MYCQVKSMRRKLLETVDCPEADFILLPSGEIGPAHKDPSLELEYESDENARGKRSSVHESSGR